MPDLYEAEAMCHLLGGWLDSLFPWGQHKYYDYSQQQENQLGARPCSIPRSMEVKPRSCQGQLVVFPAAQDLIGNNEQVEELRKEL